MTIALTGAGVVSAAGAGLDALTGAVRTKRSCLAVLDPVLHAGLPIRFGGRVADSSGGRDRVMGMTGSALDELFAGARLPDDVRARAGLTLGSGLGSMERTEAFLETEDVPLRDLHPHAITTDLADRYGLGGPLGTYTVTCASALYALEQACAELETGRAPAMVCGGLETLSRTILAGFCALDALSSTAGPDQPSPCDGIVLGEGACFLLLETLDAARARDATVHGVVRGRGLRSDGVHMTSPDTEGVGMRLAVEQALDEAGVDPAQVGRITLTAPASPGYAAMYESALGRVFGDGWQARTAGWEAAVGHLLGASTTLGIAFAARLMAGDLGEPTETVLALTVGFGGLNGATLVGRE